MITIIRLLANQYSDTAWTMLEYTLLFESISFPSLSFRIIKTRAALANIH